MCRSEQYQKALYDLGDANLAERIIFENLETGICRLCSFSNSKWQTVYII